MYMKIILLLSLIRYAAFDGMKCKYCKSEDHDGDCRKGTVSKLETCDPKEPVCVTYVTTKANKQKYAYYYRACREPEVCENEKKGQGRDLYYCKSCNGSECNNEYLFKDHFLTCLYCDSNGMDSKCALGTDTPTIRCHPSTNFCYIEVTVNGFDRGCSRKDYCETEKERHGSDLKSCMLCQGDDCNSQNAVGNCLKCRSTKKNSKCQSGDVATSEKCLGNECFQKVRKHLFGMTIYERGCATLNYCSEPPNIEGIEFCQTCKNKKHCNSLPMDSPAEGLSCITCSGRNNSCESGKTTTSVKCSPEQNVCFEQYLEDEEESLVRRGCGTATYCETEKILYGSKMPRCRVCSMKNCNNKKFVPFTCYSCETKSPLCKNNEGISMSTITCLKISDVCFHRIYDTFHNTYHHRGCSNEGFCEKSKDKACQEYHGDLLNLKQEI